MFFLNANLMQILQPCIQACSFAADRVEEVQLIRPGPEIISLCLMFLYFGLSQLTPVKRDVPLKCTPYAISPLSSRCLELHPNNLPALMALAVSLTNTGMRHDACEALLHWLRHNPRYKQLLKGKSHLMGSPNSQRRMSHALSISRHERYSAQPQLRKYQRLNGFYGLDQHFKNAQGLGSAAGVCVISLLRLSTPSCTYPSCERALSAAEALQYVQPEEQACYSWRIRLKRASSALRYSSTLSNH